MNTEDIQPERPTPLMPIVWILAGLLVIGGCLVGVGVSVAESESAGVTASYLAAFPMGFSCAGMSAAVVTHFVVRQRSASRALVPLGCGCAGGVGLLLFAVVFLVGIFPAL